MWNFMQEAYVQQWTSTANIYHDGDDECNLYGPHLLLGTTSSMKLQYRLTKKSFNSNSF